MQTHNSDYRALVTTSAELYARQKGYMTFILPFQQTNADLIPILDLSPAHNSLQSRVRLFWSRISVENLTKENFHVARSLVQGKNAPLLAFTHDGSNYRAISSANNIEGSINFLPQSPHLSRNFSEIKGINDLQPFLTIYELRQVVSRLSGLIFFKHYHDRLKLFDTLLLLFAAKMYDEIENSEDLHLPKLLNQKGSSLLTGFQILGMVALKSINCESFAANFLLDADVLHQCLEIVLPYSFRLTSDIGAQAEILGTFYQEVVSSTFRGSLGAYFTPKPIVDIATSICDPQDDIRCAIRRNGRQLYVITICGDSRIVSVT